MTVTFGSAVATRVSVESGGTAAQAIAPPHGAGVVDVQVRNPDGQLATTSGGFTYVSSPTVASVSPASGTTAGGTSVQITGSGLAPGLGVSFGGASATSVTVDPSGNSVQATTASHASGLVDVKVTNADGNSAVMVGGFTYAGVSLNNVVPHMAEPNGGTELTITGTGFTPGDAVLIGALPAAAVTLDSPTQITAVAPSQPAGTIADVKVISVDGSRAVLAAAVMYQAPPRIDSITPTSGLSAGGTAVVISGVGFVSGADGSRVELGGLPAASVTVNSSTQLTVVTPPHAVGVVSVRITNPDGASFSKNEGFRYGSVIFSDGFESGTFQAWPDTPSFSAFAPTINSLPQFVHSGLFSSSNEYAFCGVDQPTAPLSFNLTIGGALPVTTYFVRYSYIWPGFGETRSSEEQTITVPAGNLLVVSSPPPATLLTKWNVYISTSSGTEMRQNSAPIAIGSSFTLPATGLAPGEAPATSSACGASHQDLNRYFATSVPMPGLDHFFIRGYVYIEAPEADVTPNTSVLGRKLMYLKSEAGGVDHLWAVVVGTQQLPGSGQVGALPFALDSTLAPSQSFFSSSVLNFSTWYSIEVEVQANTPGVSDGVGRLYLNGALIFEQSGINFRGNSTQGISRFELGRQTDRDNTDAFHEFRFWDDIVIADAYIGP